MLQKLCNKNLADDVNLLDVRGPGSRKSLSSIHRAILRAKTGERTVLAYDNFELAEEMCENAKRLAAKLGVQIKAMVFKGRPKTCKLLEDKEEIYKYVTPTFLCSYCPYHNSCAYQEQKQRAKEAELIFTAWHDLPVVLELSNDTVVLDDIDLIAAVWRHFKVAKDEVAKLLSVLEVYKDNYPTIYAAVTQFAQGNVNNAVALASTAVYKHELKQLERVVVQNWDKFKDYELNLNLLYALWSAAKTNWEWNESRLTLSWEDRTLYKAKRLEYLNAFVTPRQEAIFAQFGNYTKLESDEQEINENVHLLGVKDGAYPLESFKRNPERLKEFASYADELLELVEAVNRSLPAEKPLKVLVVAPQDLLSSPVLSSLQAREGVKITYHYAADTYGTNRYIDYNILIVFGIHHQPPEKYELPPYSHFLAKERGLTKEQLMLEETVAYLKQLVHRLRIAKKKEKTLIIYYSKVELGLPCVAKWTRRERLKLDLHNELSWLLGDRLKKIAIKEVMKSIAGRGFRNPRAAKKIDIAKELFRKLQVFTLEFYRSVVDKTVEGLAIRGILEVNKERKPFTVVLRRFGESIDSIVTQCWADIKTWIHNIKVKTFVVDARIYYALAEPPPLPVA